MPTMTHTRWSVIVGPQLAAVTFAERQVRGGVVRVRVAPEWFDEAEKLTPKILEKFAAAGCWWVKSVQWVVSPIRATAG